ncbi:MAG: ATP synthase subunit I [Fusobacteriota bacterium]
MDKLFKKIIKRAGIITVLVFLYGFLIQEKSVYIGFTSGAVISIINFLILIRDTKKALKQENHTFRYALTYYLKRFLLVVILLGVMINIDMAHFLSATLGVFLVKFIIIWFQLKNYIKTLIERR